MDEHYSDRFNQCGKPIRKIIDGDVNFQRILSSNILSVTSESEEGGLVSNETIRVKKTVQTAEIFQCQGTFTTTTLEPVDARDRDKFKLVSAQVLTKSKNLIMGFR